MNILKLPIQSHDRILLDLSNPSQYIVVVHYLGVFLNAMKIRSFLKKKEKEKRNEDKKPGTA